MSSPAQYLDTKSGPWILGAAKALFGTLAISLKLIPAPVIILAFAMHAFGLLTFPKVYPELKRLHWKQLGTVSSLGLALVTTDITYFYAIRLMDVSASTLLRWIAPVLLSFGVFLLQRTKDGRAVIATITAFLGLGLVLGSRGIDFGTANFYGVLSALLSAISVAMYWYGAKRVLHTISPLTTIFLRSVAACLVILPLVIWSWDKMTGPWWPIIVFGLVYGLFASYIDTVGIQRTPIGLVGLIGYIVPLVSVIGAALVLGETITPLMALGGMIILISGLWAQRT